MRSSRAGSQLPLGAQLACETARRGELRHPEIDQSQLFLLSCHYAEQLHRTALLVVALLIRGKGSLVADKGQSDRVARAGLCCRIQVCRVSEPQKQTEVLFSRIYAVQYDTIENLMHQLVTSCHILSDAGSPCLSLHSERVIPDYLDSGLSYYANIPTGRIAGRGPIPTRAHV